MWLLLCIWSLAPHVAASEDATRVLNESALREFHVDVPTFRIRIFDDPWSVTVSAYSYSVLIVNDTSVRYVARETYNGTDDCSLVSFAQTLGRSFNQTDGRKLHLELRCEETGNYTGFIGLLSNGTRYQELTWYGFTGNGTSAIPFCRSTTECNTSSAETVLDTLFAKSEILSFAQNISTVGECWRSRVISPLMEADAKAFVSVVTGWDIDGADGRVMCNVSSGISLPMDVLWKCNGTLRQSSGFWEEGNETHYYLSVDRKPTTGEVFCVIRTIGWSKDVPLDYRGMLPDISRPLADDDRERTLILIVTMVVTVAAIGVLAGLWFGSDRWRYIRWTGIWC